MIKTHRHKAERQRTRRAGIIWVLAGLALMLPGCGRSSPAATQPAPLETQTRPVRSWRSGLTDLAAGIARRRRWLAPSPSRWCGIAL